MLRKCKIDFEVAGSIGIEFIGDGVGQVGLHAFENAIEIFRGDVNEAAFLEFFQTVRRVGRRNRRRHPYERKLLELDRLSDFNFIRNLNPGRANT